METTYESAAAECERYARILSALVADRAEQGLTGLGHDGSVLLATYSELVTVRELVK